MNITFWQMLSQISKGIPVVLTVFSITMIVSFLIGLVVASIYTTHLKWLQRLVSLYTFIFRGTPLLLQLLFFYFGLPILTGLSFSSALTAAICTYIFNYTAYVIEIIRSGLKGIDEGQYDAAYTFGMTKWQTMIRVIYPQALRLVIPTMTNEAVSLIKDTALLSVVAIPEITRNTKELSSSTASIMPYLCAGIIYLVITGIVMFIFRLLEKRYRLGGRTV